MNIKKAVFYRGGVKGSENLFPNDFPQIAFIGRSNAGKSSLINSLTNNSKLARTSSTPGRTKELNVFLINNAYYFIDLPGYGFAKTTFEDWKKLNELIYWYLFESKYSPKVVLIIDAEIGPTKDDLGMLKFLEENNKEVIVVANKVDKIPKSSCLHHLMKLSEMFPKHELMPYSSKTKVGIQELIDELLTKK
ncbi:MAG: ribosome biogenesis GTP-binding protein YihA/YsxC [bacterium]